VVSVLASVLFGLFGVGQGTDETVAEDYLLTRAG
jgi:hypothetical protein